MVPENAARLRAALRTVATPAAVRGTAVECAWIATHLGLYPMGLLRERVAGVRAAGRWEERYNLHGLSPAQRGLVTSDVEAAGTPILLVHGMIDNRSIFTLLRRGLRRRGFGRVSSMNYSPFITDIRAAAHDFAHRVETLCADTGYERVHVVGHSLGGLIARYYAQVLGGDARVHTLATLGTPHGGTYTANLVPHPLAEQLRPGSKLLAELAAPSPGCRTRFLAFWSDLDQLVLPHGNARIEHPDLGARNLLVHGVGHMSLPIRGVVVREICHSLAHLDARGGTVTAGVTSLAASPGGHERSPRATRVAGRRAEAGGSAGLARRER